MFTPLSHYLVTPHYLSNYHFSQVKTRDLGITSYVIIYHAALVLGENYRRLPINQFPLVSSYNFEVSKNISQLITRVASQFLLVFKQKLGRNR